MSPIGTAIRRRTSIVDHQLQYFGLYRTRSAHSFPYYRFCSFTCIASFLLFYYRLDAAKRQTAGIKFTHRPKIRFFVPQGRLVAPIHVKLGMADGHLGPLGCAKLCLNRRRGGNAAPNIKIFHFLVKSRPAEANLLTDF